MKKLPLIIDTDIGDDIDDVWALVTALCIKHFDVKLISVLVSDVDYKAKLVSKILTKLDQENVVVAKGIATKGYNFPQKKWLEDYNSNNVKVVEDFIEAMANVINQCEEKVTILALGPMLNLEKLLIKYPYLAARIKIIAMGGAIYQGYINENQASAEYNVIVSPPSYRKVIELIDDFVLVPLDVCRDLMIKEKLFVELLNNEHSVPISIILENYRLWDRDYQGGAIKFDVNKSSSILYDFGPLFYLLYPSRFKEELIEIAIMDDGSIKKGNGKKVRCLVNIEEVNLFYQEVLNYLK